MSVERTQQPPELHLPPGVERERLEHHWVLVVVTSKRTNREARRFLEGERKVFRKLDCASPEDVSSVALLCGVCKLAPASPDDMVTACPGEPLPGKSDG